MTRPSDQRLVLTLDAGGTTFVFSAMRDYKDVVAPIELPARGDDLDACLAQIRNGFDDVHARTKREAAAISFAFPGPADYANGIIGDLGNLPAFRGGVALGPMLAEQFSLPVFVNNDGDLFAYGEATSGFLPEVNDALARAGYTKRYRNLLAVTLGTGFGGGIVRDEKMFRGDNAAAGEIWALRSKLHRDCFVEEDVSARALSRVYAELTRSPVEDAPDPRVMAEIARGAGPRGSHAAAARESFRRFGEALGDALANAITLIDGLIVIGGGLSGSAPLFMPTVMAELNSQIAARDGRTVNRLEMRAFNFDDETDRAAFLQRDVKMVRVPGSTREVSFGSMKRIAIGVSKLGASRATAIGAYAFAIDALDAIDNP
jgi:glucokinase